MYLSKQEQQLDSDDNNKLSLEQANQAAQKTKAQHSAALEEVDARIGG